MNRVGIGILFYNELENAQQILEDIESLDNLGIDFYFFNNGSDDQKFLDWLQSIESRINVISVKSNIGFGGGAKYLLQRIPNEIRGYMPGNYKVRPHSLASLVKDLGSLDTLEVFKAKRSGRPFSDDVKTFLLGLLTSVYFKRNMFDSGGTPTLVTSSLIENFLDGPEDFSFEAFFLFRSRENKHKVRRSPVAYGTRIHGLSHWQSGIRAEVNLLSSILKQRDDWKI